MDSYLLLKSVHIFGVILFLGNIIISGWWKLMADRRRDPKIVAFAQRQITLTDYIFTTSGSVLILVGGVGNAMLHDMDYFHILWMAWGYALFIISGIIWLFILIPLQIKQAKMARTFAHQATIPEQYWRLACQWNIWGTIATILPLINIYWMVFKPGTN